MQLKQILLLTILSVYFVLSIHGKKMVHEYMTTEEIQYVFPGHHNAIDKIKYEVVPVFHNTAGLERGKRQVQITAFNKTLILSLDNNEDVLLGSDTKIYIPIVRNGNVVGYNSKPYPSLDKIQTYHDTENRAALTFHTDDENKVHAHGIIGDIVLRPLPSRIHNEILSKYASTYEEHEPLTGFSSDQTLHHVVIKQDSIGLANWSKIIDLNLESVDRSTDLYAQLNATQQQKIAHLNYYVSVVNKFLLNKLEPSESNKVIEKISTLNAQIKQWNQDSSWNLTSIANQLSELEKLMDAVTLKSRARPAVAEPPVQLKDTFYLELLITVDYYTFFLHGKSEEQVAFYMAAFWNSVDLRYRELKDPKIRLNIAGLVIETEEDTAPYLKYHTKECKHVLYHNWSLNATKVLGETNKHFLHYFGQAKYDLVVDITRQTLCTGNTPILGVSYSRAACSHHNNAPGIRVSRAVALVSDQGGFDGVDTAAHELGHALGAPHDKEEEYRYLNSSLKEHVKPGGKCAWEAGHVMSYLANSTNLFHFSACSIELIQNFLKSPFAECLKNKPNVGKPYPKILPGRLQDREQQCLNSANKHAYTTNNIPTDPELLMGNETAYVYDCAVLYCVGTKSYYNYSNYYDLVNYQVPIPASDNRQPPADGTSCGFKKICLDGNCIDDPDVNQ